MKALLPLGAAILLGACQMSGQPAPPRMSPGLSGPTMPRVVPGGADRAPPRVSPGSPGASGAGEPRVAPRTDTPRISPGARGGPAARLPGPDACGASDLQHLVGGPVPETFAVAGPIRVFATGDPVTMDYNPRRLNVEVSRRNRRQIVAISCG